MKKIKLKVEGLDCTEEVLLIKRVLAPKEGVKDLDFNLLQALLIVTYDPQKISPSELIALVKTTGMHVVVWNGEQKETSQSFWKQKGRLILTSLSALFLIVGTLLHLIAHPNLWDLMGENSTVHSIPLVSKILYLGAILCGVWFVLPKAFYSLRRFRPDMNLLMVVAIIGAIAIQEWFEGATVAFLFSLALVLEQWSVGRARRAISALMDLSPTLARVIDLKTHAVEEKGVESVAVGSYILVKPGEKIPLDGEVYAGNSSVDQSPITGESIPIFKEKGDEVFAGTLNENGALTCKVTKRSDATTLSKMIRLVEEARSKRSESEQWVETFARYYTPIMLLFALSIMIIPPLVFAQPWFDWIYRGLVLLVIACPCALVISTPVSIVSGLTSAAREGVLIKGGIFLELVGSLKALALDKTGTLTYGHPQVQEIVPCNEHTPLQLMERAVALERASEHPLAHAILQKGEEMGVEAEQALNFQVIKGKGALATYLGKLFWIGSHRFMHEMGQETEDIHDKALVMEDAGHSIIAIGTDDHVCGLISVADSPRKWIREIIKAIKSVGIQEVVVLTGDNEPTAKALAAHAGVDRYMAELLPEEKVDAVLELKKRWDWVGMIGDGVNDAPAMAAATVGFAMGGIGTDAAIETADVTLMSDDLSKVPWLIRHSRRVLGVIKQNIAFALGVKGLFITLALLDMATLWMAIAADTGATLLVIFNALRLLKAKGIFAIR
ncbi:MAG: Cadmium-transporting ATPase [Chlamydiales bacterium]|nr:Cadmium-transporting ATPase [Chlamydiales bacterium]